MHALTALNATPPASFSSPTTTVHAPQSPSAQPSFVPVQCASSRRYWSTVRVTSAPLTSRIARR